MLSKGHAPAVRSGHQPARRRTTLSRAIGGVLLLGAVGVGPVSAQENQAQGLIGDPASWRSTEFQRDWGLGAIRAEFAYARGLTGRGVRLGIFDDGVDFGHPELHGRGIGIRIADPGCTEEAAAILSRADGGCFLSDGDRPAVSYFHYPDEDREFVLYLISIGYLIPEADEIISSWAGFTYGSHGTHVAGTMVGRRDGLGHHGVAFDADLVSARLFSDSYEDIWSLLFGFPTLSIGPGTAAIDSMYAQMTAHGVRAINHSWGLASEPTTAAAMDNLYRNNVAYFDTFTQPSLQGGLIQVWAAGNAGGNIAGIYATLPRWIPELEPHWLAVVNTRQDNSISPGSSTCGLAMNWCVAAPGTGITSSVVGGSAEGEPIYDEFGWIVGYHVTGHDPEYGYANYNGTSMAAPHVTGALALLIERFPYMDNAQVRDVLLTTATDLGAPGVDPIYGWGLIDLERAIEGPGQIRVDTDFIVDRMAGGAKVWVGLAWDDWTNDIGGPGRLTKSGVGWLRLSGDNTFGGATVREGILELDGSNALSADVVIAGGHLFLNGSLVGTDLRIDSGSALVRGSVVGGQTLVGVDGLLAGTGTLGNTRVDGTIAPGLSIGTLTVVGDYIQGVGSNFHAELGRGGASDRLVVSGHAQLQGGTLHLLRGEATGMLLGESYQLIEAGSLAGAFAAVNRTAYSPFMDFDLTYSANGVLLDVVRGQSLAGAAQTRNQVAVAGAADGLAMNHGLSQALVQLFPADARTAFDLLSGELHASAHSVMIDGARQVRAAALARGNARGGDVALADDEDRTAAWGELLRSGGRLAGDGNAAGVHHDSEGGLVGVDHRFAGGWRLGALGGLGRTDMQAPERASRGRLSTRHLGVHGGQSWGGLSLSAGLALAWHDVRINREVAVPGLDDRTRAVYDATTTQAFVEAGYRFGGEGWSLEPFAQAARVSVDTDGFGETGGLAALAGGSADADVDLATWGLRGALDLKAARQDASWLSLRGSVARRHAGGDRLPETPMGWTGGGAFSVEGAPLARRATVVEAGFAARTGQGSLLEFGYSGQFADEARDHAVNARWSTRF